jgi:hypothetical protein
LELILKKKEGWEAMPSSYRKSKIKKAGIYDFNYTLGVPAYNEYLLPKIIKVLRLRAIACPLI